MGDEEQSSIVCDNGSGMVKAGFSGDDAPRCVFPSIVGRPKTEQPIMGGAKKDCHIGDDAQARRGILTIRYPIEHGVVTNWDDMEKVWHHTFENELRVSPEDRTIMLTEAPWNPLRNREKIAEIMFAVFGVKRLYIAHPGVLSTYSTGRMTAVVLDCGCGVTHVTPVFEGGYNRMHIERSNYGGTDLNDYMMKLLMESGYTFVTSAEKETVRSIKEQLCYVALDYEEELHLDAREPHEGEFELPDGTTIKVGNQRFRCPEALFKPSLTGSEAPGLHEMVVKSVGKSDFDIRRDLYANILLSGGTTMHKGLPERLNKEIANLAPSSIKPKVVAPPERKYGAWIGGSILSSLTTFQSLWISREQFNECGPSVVHNAT